VAILIGVAVAVTGFVVIAVRHANGWGVPGAFLVEMEEREAAAAAAEAPAAPPDTPAPEANPG